MEFYKSSYFARKWGMSERSIRNYCAEGKIPGALLEGKTWKIPEQTEKPERKPRLSKMPEDILPRLKIERNFGISGGIYHKVQIELTYNSNHIEGSKLSHDQTKFIFDTNTIGVSGGVVAVDDIVETSNHFKCVDIVIDMANYKISETMIKQLHNVLKLGTSDSRKTWFAVGEYKKAENEVGGGATAKPADVASEMKKLLDWYNSLERITIKEIVEFHYRFEKIHPFQDGNGRIGRLLAFKECLRNNVTPFIIYDDIKMFYYRGLAEWEKEPGFLIDTCLTAQDRFKKYMDYFGLKYKD